MKSIDFYVSNAKVIEPACELGRYSWPFRKMDVDDSVLIVGDAAIKSQVAAFVCGRQIGFRFTSRSTRDGMLIARIA